MRKYFGRRNKDAMSSIQDKYSSNTIKEDKELHVLIDGHEYVRKSDEVANNNQKDKIVKIFYLDIITRNHFYDIEEDDEFYEFLSNLSVSYNIHTRSSRYKYDKKGTCIMLEDYMSVLRRKMKHEVYDKISDVISKQIIVNECLEDVNKLRMLVQALESICINTTFRVVINTENVLIAAAVDGNRLFTNTPEKDATKDKWLALKCALDFLIKTINIRYEYNKLDDIETKIREHKIEIGYEDGYVYGIRIENSTIIKLQGLIEMLTISK